MTKTGYFDAFYGKVLEKNRRGSVIPLWIDQIKAGNPITITEPSMTRFIMSLDKAVDLGDFYRVLADNRGLNYDKYFREGDEARNTLTEFNSNNTRRLNLQETIDTIAALDYIKKRMAEE